MTCIGPLAGVICLFQSMAIGAGVANGATIADAIKQADWQKDFELIDYMRIYNFPEELISYPVEFPAGKVRADGLVLAAMHGDNPELIAFQLSDVVVKNGFLERATLNFRTDLPKGATRRFVLAALPEVVAPAAAQGCVLAELEPGTGTLAANLLRVRVPRVELNAPVALSQAPAPIIAISRAGAFGQWVGAGSFAAAGDSAADMKVTAITTQMLAEGPLFAVCRIAYTLTGNRAYTVDLTVRHNETFVTVDEYFTGFSPDDAAFLRFDLVPGFDPDTREVMNNGGYKQYSGALDKAAEGFLPFGTGVKLAGKLPIELGLNVPNSYGIMRSVAFYRNDGEHGLLLSLYRIRDWKTARRRIWYDTWGGSNFTFFCNDGAKYLLGGLQGAQRHWAMALIPRADVVQTSITNKRGHEAGPEVRLWQKLSGFSLDKVKDMRFDWDESPQRRLPDAGEQITWEEWNKRYGMEAPYWFLNAIVNLYWDYSAITGPPSFRAMPRWYGDYDASRASWTLEQRRHVRSILVWMAESCEDDNNLPHHSMLAGHPNFVMDVKQTLPLAAAVLADHPHAKRWRDSFVKFFEEWLAAYQRDTDPEHNALGGRWTENIACYSGTALVATLHSHKALQRFDGTDLLDHPRVRAWIAWYVNAMMSPHDGLRLVPPEGAHSRSFEPSNAHGHLDALFEIPRLMRNTAPDLSNQMRWIETNGKEGTRPPLRSVLINDYGPVLRHDFGGPNEAYLHLMQISGPWNYRWGAGHSVLYYGAKNKAWSVNTMEEAGDAWNLNNVTSFTANGRGLGRRSTDQPLHDFGFAQFYRALGAGGSPCLARSMMMLRDDYIVLHDDVRDNADGQFVWASVFDLPQIYQLKPGAEFTEATSTDPRPRPGAAPARTATIRRYTGKGDFLTVVAPTPIKAEATPFGAIANGEYVFCSDAPQEHAQGKTAFEGTYGYAREKQLALFEGTRISLNGFTLRREGGDFGASADATGKQIVGRVAGCEGVRLFVTPPQGFNANNVKVTVGGKAVKAAVNNGEIGFDLTISLREGYKTYTITF